MDTDIKEAPDQSGSASQTNQDENQEVLDQTSGQTEKQGSAEGQAEQPEGEVSERTKKGKPILDPNNLPDDASSEERDYRNQLLRWYTSRNDEIREQREQLERMQKELEEKASQFQSNGTQTQAPQHQKTQSTVDPNEVILQQELANAISEGDTEKVYQVNAKIADYRFQKNIEVIAPHFNKSLEEIKQAQQRTQNAQLIEEFARIHPDFTDFKVSGMAAKYVDYYESRGKKPREALEMAYKDWVKDREFFGSQAEKVRTARIQEKKNAVSATPTPSVDTEIVYVGSRDEERRLNTRFAVEGSPKIAKFKKGA